MRDLMINPPGGYVPLISSEYESNDISEHFNLNTLFWKDIFSDTNIKKTIEYAENYYKSSEYLPLKIQVILYDTSKFYVNLKQALNFTFTNNTTKQEFFSCLETLQMFCDLYTFCWSSPYRLTIAEGFVHNKESAEILNEYCMNNNYNPYLSFIQETIIPKLVSMKPDILWISGRPDIAIFALVKHIKIIIPHIYVVLCDPKTEYYSLYKIKDLLIRNTILFKLFDCILFSNSTINRKIIVDSVRNKCVPQNISGGIYKDKEKIIFKEDTSYISDELSSIKKTSLKLFNNHYCYWNKCSFCGINQKYCYPESNFQWNISQAINTLRARSNKQYMWLIDEAIPPVVLKKLLIEFSKNNFNFVWHFRTRIEPELIDLELVELMQENGVKSIILGFESASQRILKKMNKTFNEDYINIAEKIVDMYTNKGIHVHFPVLIGFPTETNTERESSFKFVEYLSEKYSLFSYNINILELDISSTLFKQWQSYDIKQLKFPCLPKHFLGNCLEWEVDYEMLEQQRTIQMKKQFAWYPDESNLSINIFYNLWEQKKGLLCNEISMNKQYELFDINSDYALNTNTLLLILVTGEFCIYNYDTHNFICGGTIIEKIYTAFSKHLNIKQIIDNEKFFEEEILLNFISDLYKLKIIIKKIVSNDL